jgi:hypothetical protein
VRQVESGRVGSARHGLAWLGLGPPSVARESNNDDDNDENADANANASLQWSGGDLDANNDKDDDELDKIVTSVEYCTTRCNVCRIFDI